MRLRSSLDLSNVSVESAVTKNSPLRREQNVKQVLKPVSTIVTVEPDICEHYIAQYVERILSRIENTFNQTFA